MRTTYKEINEDKYQVFIHSGIHVEMIGTVYRDWHRAKGLKWAIEAKFMSLLADHNNLVDVYIDMIDAGRILAAAWSRSKNACQLEITADYNMDDIFGSD